MKSLSVIIPCKDEVAAIDLVMARFKEARELILRKTSICEIELLVIDDNSTDGSLELLRKHDGIRVISSPKNLGYGGALKIGLQAARGELVAFYDMDYTYDPVDLPPMIEKLQTGEFDMVCGDRLSRIEGMPWTRELGNRFFVGIIERIFRRRVRDACTGMRVFRRAYIETFLKLLPNDLNFTLAMTLLFLRFRIPFCELDIRYNRRVGRSKLLIFVDGPRFLSTILWFWLSHSFRSRRKRQAAHYLAQARALLGQNLPK